MYRNHKKFEYFFRTQLWTKTVYIKCRQNYAVIFLKRRGENSVQISNKVVLIIKHLFIIDSKCTKIFERTIQEQISHHINEILLFSCVDIEMALITLDKLFY